MDWGKVIQDVAEPEAKGGWLTDAFEPIPESKGWLVDAFEKVTDTKVPEDDGRSYLEKSGEVLTDTAASVPDYTVLHPVKNTIQQMGEAVKSLDTGVKQAQASAYGLGLVTTIAGQQGRLKTIDDYLNKSKDLDEEGRAKLEKMREEHLLKTSKMIDDYLGKYITANKKLSQAWSPDSVKELQKAQGFVDAMKVIAKNPLELSEHLMLQSAPSMLPGVAAMVMNPAAGALVIGGSSTLVEMGGALGDYLVQQKIDISDKEAVMEFFQDPSKTKAAIAFAAAKGVPIGILDGLSAALAPVQLGKTVFKNALKQGALGTASDAGGELAGQLASQQTLPPDQRQGIHWGDVMAEVIAGGPTQIVEVAAAGGHRPSPQVTRTEKTLADVEGQLKVLEREILDAKAQHPNDPANQEVPPRGEPAPKAIPESAVTTPEPAPEPIVAAPEPAVATEDNSQPVSDEEWASIVAAKETPLAAISDEEWQSQIDRKENPKEFSKEAREQREPKEPPKVDYPVITEEEWASQEAKKNTEGKPVEKRTSKVTPEPTPEEKAVAVVEEKVKAAVPAVDKPLTEDQKLEQKYGKDVLDRMDALEDKLYTLRKEVADMPEGRSKSGKLGAITRMEKLLTQLRQNPQGKAQTKAETRSALELEREQLFDLIAEVEAMQDKMDHDAWHEKFHDNYYKLIDKLSAINDTIAELDSDFVSNVDRFKKSTNWHIRSAEKSKDYVRLVKAIKEIFDREGKSMLDGDSVNLTDVLGVVHKLIKGDSAYTKSAKFILGRIISFLEAMNNKLDTPVQFRVLETASYDENSPIPDTQQNTGTFLWFDAEEGKTPYLEVLLRLAINIYPDGTVETHNLNGFNLETILHEAIHAVSYSAIELYKQGRLDTNSSVFKAVDRINQVFQDFLEEGNISYTASKYAEQGSNTLEDLHEFVAWGLSNARMYSEYVMRDSPFSRAVAAIKEYILNLLGIDTTSVNTSTYEELLAFLNKITHTWMLTDKVQSNVYKRDGTTILDGDSPVAHMGARAPYSLFEEITPSDSKEFKYEGTHDPTSKSGDSTSTRYAFVFVKDRLTGKLDHIAVNYDYPGSLDALKAKYGNLPFVSAKDSAHLVRSKRTYADHQIIIQKMKAVDAMEKALAPTGDRFGEITDPLIATELAVVAPDLPTNVTDMFSAGTTTKGVLTNNPIVKWLRGQIHQVITAQSVMARGPISEIDKMFHSLDANERVMAMKTLIKLDELEVDADPALLTRLQIPKNVQDLILKIRQVDEDLFNQWNAARLSINQPPIPRRPGHFPGIFKGDYRAVAHDSSGHIIGVATSYTNHGLQSMKKKLKAQFPGIIWQPDIRTSLAQTGAANKNMFDAFQSVKAILGGTVNNTAFTLALRQLMAEDANFVMGFGQHSRGKKGVWGSQGKNPLKSDRQNAQDAFNAFVDYLEEGALHHSMLPILDDMSGMITNQTLRKEKPRLVAYLEMMYTHMSRKNPSGGISHKNYKMVRQLGQGIDKTVDAMLTRMGVGPNVYRKGMSLLRSIFATFVMGIGAVGFAALQIVQVPTFGFLGASGIRSTYRIPFYKGRVAFLKAGVQMILHFIEWSLGKMGVKVDLIRNPETKRAIKYAEDHGLINLSELEKAQEARLSKFERILDTGLNITQRGSEAATRPYVFMWYYETLRAGGMPEAQALQRARNATQFSMAAYHSLERATFFQGIGTIGPAVGQLKTFALSAVAQEYHWAKQGIKRGNPMPLANVILLYLLVYGLSNAPGYDELDAVLRRITGRTGLSEYVQAHVPEWVEAGLISHWSNIDIQGRLRFPPWISLQNTAKIKHFEEFPMAFMRDMGATIPSLGFYGQKIDKLMAYMFNPSQSNKEIMVSTMLPVSAQGIYEEMKFKGPKGELLRKDDTGIDRPRTEFDWKLRRLGLRSLSDRKALERLREAEEDAQVVDKSKQATGKRLAQGIVSSKNQLTPAEIDKLVEQYVREGGDPKYIPQLIKEAAINQTLTNEERFVGRSPRKASQRLWFFEDKK